MYGGLQPGFWNDGAHGVITVKTGTRTQYVHVVTRPRYRLRPAARQRLPDHEVTDLRTGERMRFSQSGGYLSILDIRNWDEYDTVFKVRDRRPAGFLPTSRLRNGHGVGRRPPGERAGRRRLHDLLGQRQDAARVGDARPRQAAPASYLAVHQREWSPTYARESFGRPEDSARIKDFTVSVSDDGKRWRQVRSRRDAQCPGRAADRPRRAEGPVCEAGRAQHVVRHAGAGVLQPAAHRRDRGRRTATAKAATPLPLEAEHADTFRSAAPCRCARPARAKARSRAWAVAR